MPAPAASAGALARAHSKAAQLEAAERRRNGLPTDRYNKLGFGRNGEGGAV